MVVQALLVSLIVGLGILDEHTIQFQTTRAIVTGPVVGLLLGDIKTGLIIGATVEMMFLSNVIVGFAMIPDVTMASAISTALAILGNVPTEVAVSLAVPVAVFGQLMWTVKLNVFSVPITHMADKPAENGNVKGVMWTPIIGGLAFVIFLFMVPTFVAVYAGPQFVSSLVDKMPQTLLDGFAVGTGMLSAVGFAMLINMMTSKKFIAFLFVGYALASYANLSIMGIVIIAIAVAALYIVLGKEKGSESA